MLHQSVRLYLQQQNRLTYSSLQGVLRQYRTVHQEKCGGISGFTVKNNCLNPRIDHSSRSFCIGVKKKTNSKSDKKWTVVKDEIIKPDASLVETTELKNNFEMQKEIETDVDGDGRTKPLSLLNIEIDDENSVDDISERLSVSESDSDFEEVGNKLAIYEEGYIMEKENLPQRLPVASDMFYKPKSIVQSLLEEENKLDIDRLEREDKFAENVDQYLLERIDQGELAVDTVKKVVIPEITNLAPIVNDSKVLTKMVQLGVDLTVIQKKGMIQRVLELGLDKKLEAYIWFLKDCKVSADKIGEVITKCPWMFQHDVHNLRVRVDYLRSKKFSGSQISNMLDKDPKFLLIPVEKIDAKLGFLQQEFRLTGNQLREKVGGLSKLIITRPIIIKEKKHYMKKMLGFSDRELRSMFLTYPKIFLLDGEYVARRFDYLHNVLEIPHEIIAKTPQALKKPMIKLENRHRFLVKCGRAQYNPTEPNYVSLQALITERDETWCLEVAKASVAEYNQFLRLI